MKLRTPICMLAAVIGCVFLSTKMEAQSQRASVVWPSAERVNMSATGNSVEHNGGGWFAQARSQQEIESGVGYFEWTFDGEYGQAGLGAGRDEAPSASHLDIDFAFHFPNATSYEIRQSGVHKAEGSAAAGDVFRVEIASDGRIIYKKNTNQIWAENNPPAKTYPYYLVFKTGGVTGYGISNAFMSPAPAGAIPPTAPTGLAAANGAGNDVVLTWNDNSDDESSFRVERKLGTKGNYSEIGSVGANEETYTDASQKSPNSPYIYRVMARSGEVESAYSNEDDAVTPYTGGAQISESLVPVFTPTPPPLPLRGGKWHDETFGTQLMRVTDERDGPSLGNVYSYWPTFNSNNQRLLVAQVGGGHYIQNFDPVNFALDLKDTLGPFIGDGGKPHLDGATWDTQNPDVLYAIDDLNQKRLLAFNVETKVSSVLKDFTAELTGVGTSPFLNQLRVSADNNVFAATIYHAPAQPKGYVVWRKNPAAVLKQIDDINTAHREAGDPVLTQNEVAIDKGGRYLTVINDPPEGQGPLVSGGAQRVHVWDLQTGGLSTIRDTTPYYAPNHFDMQTGFVVGGEDTEGRLAAWSLAAPDHSRTELYTFNTASPGSHTSSLAINESWSLFSFYMSSSTSPQPLRHEIAQFSTAAPGRVRRLCHHFSYADHPDQVKNYFNSPRANISRDGKYVAFTSTWGDPYGRQDLFVARITPAPSFLSPLADAYVKGSTPDTNYGTVAELQIKRAFTPGSGTGRQAYLRFDTSAAAGPITKATLRVYGRLNAVTAANVNIPLAVFPVSSVWGELTLTWNNKPAPDVPSELARVTVTDDTARWYEFDITSFIQQERAAGRAVTGVLLRNMQSGDVGDYYTAVNSKEAAADRPQLVIEH